jgi:hypothetical protein
VSKLQWTSSKITICERFAVQTEHVREEGVCYSLMCSREDHKRAEELDIEMVFYGRGGISKVKAAAQEIADAYPVWSQKFNETRKGWL